MFFSEPQSVDPGGGRSLGREGREKKGGHVFWLFIGEESWELERRFPLQLGFKGLLSGTKLKMHGIYQSALHVSFRHCHRGAIFIALVWCVSVGCKFMGGVLCASFCYGFEGLTGSQHA